MSKSPSRVLTFEDDAEPRRLVSEEFTLGGVEVSESGSGV
jgi:hypothetical protein